jgi:competence protein ComEA
MTTPPRMFQSPSWRRRLWILFAALVCAISLGWIGWKSSTEPAAAAVAAASDTVSIVRSDASVDTDSVLAARFTAAEDAPMLLDSAGLDTLDAAAPPSAVEVLADGGVIVDLNTANEEELKRLPSVGPARARAIVELRRRLGRFKGVDDLARIKGFGRATLRKLRPLTRASSPDPRPTTSSR